MRQPKIEGVCVSVVGTPTQMEYSANFVSASDAATGAPVVGARKVALRLKGKPREGQENAHLSIVLDTSDSMNDGHKLETCNKSIGFVLDLMRDTDAVSLVTFDEVSRVVSPLMSTTAEKKTNFRTLVNSVHTDGCTNMSAGLLEAKGLLEDPTAGRKQGMLLLTDGHANRGVYIPDQLFTLIKTMMESRPDLTVHTIGYGFDHNADLLSKIAEWTGGTYSVVKNLEDVATVFGSVLGSMVSTTAQNVRIILPEGFKLLSQNQTEKDTEGRTVVRVGDIQSEVSSILLLEVPAPAEGVTLTPLYISGVDLLTHEPIVAEVQIEPPQALSEEDARNLDLAFLRVEIVDLMKEVREGASRLSANPTRTAEILAKLDTFEARLATAPSSLAGMVGLMKGDIRLMRDILTGRSRDMAADRSMLSQHENVWTTQRGVTCGVAAPAAAECSPFVSRVTSNYVGLMRATSSQAAPPRDPNSNTYDSDDEDPNVYSGQALLRRQHTVHFAQVAGTPPASPPMTPAAPLPTPPAHLAAAPTNS